MIDLTPLAQDAFSVFCSVALTAVYMLARRGMSFVEQHFHLKLSQQAQDTVLSAVDIGVGLLRTKLATGAMKLNHVDISLGSEHVDQAANVAMSLIFSELATTKISKDDVSRMILARLGHALGEDPTVPSVQPEKAAA